MLNLMGFLNATAAANVSCTCNCKRYTSLQSMEISECLPPFHFFSTFCPNPQRLCLGVCLSLCLSVCFPSGLQQVVLQRLRSCLLGGSRTERTANFSVCFS